MDVKVKKIAIVVLSCFLAVSSIYAEGDIIAGKAKSQTCMACHGSDGNSLNNEWPNLAGQHATYLYKQMQDFKKGEQGGRYNTVMTPLMLSLSDQDMQDIAAYYASLENKTSAIPQKYVELGQAIYRGGNLSQHITACIACHGPKGSGYKSAGFPVLSGQHAKYILNQLIAFHNDTRRNSPNEMMNNVVSRMTPAEMESVAYYVEGLH